jgi:hypothetical protein
MLDVCCRGGRGLTAAATSTETALPVTGSSMTKLAPPPTLSMAIVPPLCATMP